MNELTKIFKTVFDSNVNLKRLICGDKNSLDYMAFEDLEKLGYIVEELDAENAASMNESKPCMFILSEDEGVFGSKYVNLQIICRHDYMYMGNGKLRYMEIVSEISEAIHQKAVYGTGILELETVKCVPIDDYVCAVVASFRTNEEEITESVPKIISYYKEEMFGTLKEVFESDGVKDCLCINGEYGTRMSFEEMLEKGFVRMTPVTQADFTLKNTYAVVQIDYIVGVEMTVSILASSGGAYMELAKAEMGMAADLISKRVTAAENVIMTSNDTEELSESISAITMKFSMDASKEDIERIENRNKIDIRFFAGLDVLQAVPTADIKVGGQVAGIAVDLINGPYRLTFANKEILEFGFHMRYAFGVDDNPMFKVTMKSLEAEPEIALKQEFDEASFNMVMSMFMSISNLSAFLDGVDITGQFAEMDVEKEGILLYLDNGEIKFKRVSGADRPDLPCNNMGNIEMGRPYADELGEALSKEMNEAAAAEEEGPSLKEMIEAAEAGDMDMINTLAGIYAEGKARILDEEQGNYISVEADPEKEFYWCKKGADLGNSSAMFNVGLYYAKGFGVERDFEKAAEWMRKADEAGEAGAGAQAEKYEAMIEWLPKAEAGDAMAQGIVSNGYMSIGSSLQRCGGEADYAEALKWAELAQGKDYGESYLVLGLAYENGRGVERDAEKAAEYYKKGADMGHMVCINNYGLANVLGSGIPQNRVLGFECFLKAAEMGYGLAMQNVGMCYENADGTDFNLEKALEWYEKSLDEIPDEQIKIKVDLLKQYLEKL